MFCDTKLKKGGWGKVKKMVIFALLLLPEKNCFSKVFQSFLMDNIVFLFYQYFNSFERNNVIIGKIPLRPAYNTHKATLC